MKKRTWLWIYILTAVLLVCGTVMLFSRGVIPDTDGWVISHETQNNEYIRTETGVITEDYLGQYVVINTARQHLDVFVGDELALSSRDYDYSGQSIEVGEAYSRGIG